MRWQIPSDGISRQALGLIPSVAISCYTEHLGMGTLMKYHVHVAGQFGPAFFNTVAAAEVNCQISDGDYH